MQGTGTDYPAPSSTPPSHPRTGAYCAAFGLSEVQQIPGKCSKSPAQAPVSSVFVLNSWNLLDPRSFANHTVWGGLPRTHPRAAGAVARRGARPGACTLFFLPSTPRMYRRYAHACTSRVPSPVNGFQFQNFWFHVIAQNPIVPSTAVSQVEISQN